MRWRTIALASLAAASGSVSLPANAKPADIWKKLAARCGAQLGQNVYDGKMTFFGPMNSYGAGSIFRAKGKGKVIARLINTALPTPPALQTTINVQSCQNKTGQTFGGKAGVEAAASQMTASGSISGKKIESVTIEPSEIGWASIDGFALDQYYRGLTLEGPAAVDSVRAMLSEEFERSDTLVMTRAMIVKNVKITYVLKSGLSAEVQGEVKQTLSDAVSGNANASGTWTNANTLVITQTGTSYLFGLLQPFEGAHRPGSVLSKAFLKGLEVPKSFAARKATKEDGSRHQVFGKPIKADVIEGIE